jgi:hypothetical protein
MYDPLTFWLVISVIAAVFLYWVMTAYWRYKQQEANMNLAMARYLDSQKRKTQP